MKNSNSLTHPQVRRLQEGEFYTTLIGFAYYVGGRVRTRLPREEATQTAAQSASTMILASSGVITLGVHPRIVAAREASPIRESTSDGRT